MKEITENIKERLDQLEIEMLQQSQTECPVVHTFTPGLYHRQIFMPANCVVVSKIHKTRHQFVVSFGSAMVKINDNEWEEISAPYSGITEPGTRRVLAVGDEGCIWSTFHATDIHPDDESYESVLKAAELIEERIIEKNKEIIEYKKQIYGNCINGNVTNDC